MWALYEPKVRSSQAGSLETPKFVSVEGPNSGEKNPSTAEKLWFLLEPTSPLTRRSRFAKGIN